MGAPTLDAFLDGLSAEYALPRGEVFEHVQRMLAELDEKREDVAPARRRSPV